jgi:hypothetical protein
MGIAEMARVAMLRGPLFFFCGGKREEKDLTQRNTEIAEKKSRTAN